MNEQEQLARLFNEEIYVLAEEAIMPSSDEVSTVQQTVEVKPAVKVKVEAKIDLQVEAEVESVPEKHVLPQELQEELIPVFRGNNKKGIVILVENAMAKDISPAQMAFLQKIVTAIQLTSNDVALANYSLPENRDILQMGSVLIGFGLSGLKGYAGDLTLYQVLKENDRQFLFSDSIDTLEGNSNLKRKLWQALQVMFGLV
ncbi:MAG: hypothetical protein OEX02_02150 [Cyclobacteriaceae bacterium]|nr:hypothetical protein [Cyclobacteriaceae bacterium]